MSATSETYNGLDARHLAALDPEKLSALAETWQPEARAAIVEYLRSAQKRQAIIDRYRDVCDLAKAIDPNFEVTPALALIGAKAEVSLRHRRRNLMINMPPQEGKSTLAAQYLPLRALQLNPNFKIILATYGESLAHDHSRTMREIISRHGSNVVDAMTGVEIDDKLGFQINPGSNKVDNWRVSNGRGGVTAVGLHGSITGRGADLMIIDDPYKDMIEADSPTQRDKVASWFRSVARTRLSPNASIILIQTRWHPEDLAGEILDKEKKLDQRYRTWHHINIPAVSEIGITDSLRRDPGVEMISARGDRDWPGTRRDVGDRVWYALYQGMPRNPSGGLFKRSWFEDPMEIPEVPVVGLVGIDPADTGKDDETGIIGGYACPNGKVLLAHDWSGQYTSDQWSKKAIELTLRMGAREIAFEAYTTADTYMTMLKRAWKDIQKAAMAKKKLGLPMERWEKRACVADMPFLIKKWRGRANADAVARSGLIRQAFETRKAKVVPEGMETFVDQACDWQIGQHQPDRVAAGVVTHDRLVKLMGGQVTTAAPVDRSASDTSTTQAAPSNVVPIFLRRTLSGRSA